jgi:hypothetical protein
MAHLAPHLAPPVLSPFFEFQIGAANVHLVLFNIDRGTELASLPNLLVYWTC